MARYIKTKRPSHKYRWRGGDFKMQYMRLPKESLDFLKERGKCVEDIINNQKYMELKKYPRHKYTNTYDHSVRVAIGAAIIAEMIGADVESAIKIGLTHDMCFVNYYERNNHKGLYAFYHPVEAADNGDKEFGLTDRERKAIKAHMFPLSVHIPTSREALALTLSDKAIATYEGLYGFRVFRRMLMGIGMRRLAVHSY